MGFRPLEVAWGFKSLEMGLVDLEEGRQFVQKEGFNRRGMAGRGGE